MSDLLGTALRVNNGLADGGETPTDLLVEAFRRTQQKPIDDLNLRKNSLESRQVFFNSLRSRLEALSSSIDDFADSSESIDSFLAKKATSSDNSVATVAADGDAVVSVTTLKVNRLATNDILVSDRLNDGDASGFTAGSKSFDLTLDDETVTIAVEFDGTEDFETALEKIADAVNASEDISITAGVLRDTESTVRLTLTARDSGSAERIQFTDTDSVLAQLGIDAALTADPANRTAFSATDAGFLLTDSSELDAEFEVNGVTVTRGSNEVTNIINGLSFTLLKAQDSSDAALTISSDVNPDGVRSNVNPLLNNFNALLDTLNGSNSPLRSDFAVGNLRSNLRGVATDQLLETGTFRFLSDVGIGFAADGKLSIDKLDALKDALVEDPSAVADLFAAFSTRLDSALDGLLGEEGLIEARKDSLSTQIKNISQRVDTLESRVDVQSDSLRKQFEDLQLLFVQAQQQFSLISSFSSNPFNNGSS